MTIQVPHKIFPALGLVLLTAVPALAGWRDQIAPPDAQRLSRLDESRAQALAEAARGGSGDARAIRQTFAAAPHAVPERALYGSWRCRQIKLGGMTGYAVFSWFPCRISRAHGGLWFEKQGTQRMAGYLYPDDGRFVYLGAQSARGEPWHRYSGNAAFVGADTNPDDQVGMLVGIGPNRLRLDLPAPATQESDFDAIELVR